MSTGRCYRGATTCQGETANPAGCRLIGNGALDSKSGVSKGTGGSNPSLSATETPLNGRSERIQTLESQRSIQPLEMADLGPFWPPVVRAVLQRCYKKSGPSLAIMGVRCLDRLQFRSTLAPPSCRTSTAGSAGRRYSHGAMDVFRLSVRFLWHQPPQLSGCAPVLCSS